MVIDIDTGIIEDAEVPPFCELSSNFVADILRGRCIDTDMDEILKTIERTVHTHTRRALITAIQTLYNRYTISKNRRFSSEKINNPGGER
jgi:hypothetical protein